MNNSLAMRQIQQTMQKISQQRLYTSPIVQATITTPWQNTFYSKEECIMAIDHKCRVRTYPDYIIIKEVTDNYINDFYSPYSIYEIPFIDNMRKNNSLFKLVGNTR